MSRVRLILADTAVPAGNTITAAALTDFSSAGVVLDPNVEIATGNGRCFRFEAFGYLTSKASAPGTLALSVRWKNATSTTLGTATLTLPSSLTNAGWWMKGVVVVTATGASQGRVACQAVGLLDAAGTPVSFSIVNTGVITPTNGTAGNNNITLGMAATFSATGNSVTLSQLLETAAD